MLKKAEKERLRRSNSISGPDLSQGRKCLRAGLVLWFAAGHVLGSDLSKHFEAGLVSGLDLSCGRTCPKTSGLEVSKSFRARSVSRKEVSKSLGPEVSRSRTWFAAGSVLELFM